MKSKIAPPTKQRKRMTSVEHQLKSLRALPPPKFRSWAVTILGGEPRDSGADTRGFAGRICPARGGTASNDSWWPLQARRKDKVEALEIRMFEGVLFRHDRTKGFFVAFDYSASALKEVDRCFRLTDKVIVPLTVREILEEQIARKLA
jgi:hypothetical protein